MFNERTEELKKKHSIRHFKRLNYRNEELFNDCSSTAVYNRFKLIVEKPNNNNQLYRTDREKENDFRIVK